MSESIIHFRPVFFISFNEKFSWPIFRFMIHTFLGISITFILFVGMQKLIEVDWVEPDDKSVPVFDDVVMPEDVSIEEHKSIVIEKIESQKPPLDEPEAVDNVDIDVEFSLPATKVKVDRNVISIGQGTNQFPVAQYLVRAKYPSRALSMGVEGYVDLRFDVNTQGQTENITVVASNPDGIFNKAALKAVAKWRYQPKLEDGVPKPFYGLTNRVRFTISP